MTSVRGKIFAEHCSFNCYVSGSRVGGGPVVIHGHHCPSIAGWAWPIPPEHAGPCACRRAPGYEHFTEHTPIGCSSMPHALTEVILAGPRYPEDDEVGRREALDVLEEIAALAEHRRRAHPDLVPHLPPVG